MSIKLLPDLDTQKRIADATEEIASKLGGSYIPITYADLVSLRVDENLKKGAFYRIIDYETTTTQPETRSAGHYFDVIVQALDEKTLSENAQAIHSVRDTDGYFNNVKLEAWKLKYCLDNDANRFAWADEVNGKGVIYRLIDEWNNDVPYDFKNIQFKRYRIISSDKVFSLIGKFGITGAHDYEIDNDESYYMYTFNMLDLPEDEGPEIPTDVSVFQDKYTDNEGACHKTRYNIVRSYGEFVYNVQLERVEYLQQLNDIVFTSSFSMDVTYGGFYAYKANTFGDDCYSNTFGSDCSYNTFENGCSNNTFGRGSSYNTFGGSCSFNTFGRDSGSNTLGSGSSFNTFDNDCASNAFGVGCNNNTFGNNCNFNTFGDGFYSNTIGSQYGSNTFGDGCESNTFEDSCNNNTFGNDCSSNTFGNDCNSNTFGNICSSNTFGGSCSFNTFGNDCNSNTFGNVFRYNTLGNYCQYLKISDSSYNPKIYIHIESGIRGASSSNQFELYDSAILGKGYQITFKKSASGKYLMLWATDTGTIAGKLKATNTAAEWTDMPANFYTRTEIDDMIGNIESVLDTILGV